MSAMEPGCFYHNMCGLVNGIVSSKTTQLYPHTVSFDMLCPPKANSLMQASFHCIKLRLHIKPVQNLGSGLVHLD